MFAPPGGRFPPNLPPLFFSTGFLSIAFARLPANNIGRMQLPPELETLFTQGVTEVMFVGAKDCYQEKSGVVRAVQSPLSDDSKLGELLISLALEAGSRLDIAKPLADFSVANYRLSAQLKSAVTDRPCLTIRKHPKTAITMKHLISAEFLTSEQAQFLVAALGEGKTLLISGPTSAGKTTLLGALIRASGQRVVAVEQTPELVLQPPSIRLTERPNNQQGVGLISQSELLTAALRMRPDRLAIGEVRGAEFVALLQAVNNGHPALATIHSRRIDDLPSRLTLLGQLSSVSADLVATLCQAIDFVIQVEYLAGHRKVSKLAKFKSKPEFGVVEIEV
ncbi:MAG: Flp pilus assembly complex ATPase component TadA [Actinomycetota bacterium]|jgi:pilus assembly protein CpaF